jgi:hypothetical protein
MWSLTALQHSTCNTNSSQTVAGNTIVGPVTQVGGRFKAIILHKRGILASLTVAI